MECLQCKFCSKAVSLQTSRLEYATNKDEYAILAVGGPFPSAACHLAKPLKGSKTTSNPFQVIFFFGRRGEKGGIETSEQGTCKYCKCPVLHKLLHESPSNG